MQRSKKQSRNRMFSSAAQALFSCWRGSSAKYQSGPSMLDVLNDDCKIHILSFLSSEDMNSFAVCSRDCRRLRANESLDQTRTVTIVWTRSTTFHSLMNMIRQNSQVFTGNRTSLKIVSVEKKSFQRIFAWRARARRGDHSEYANGWPLPEVTSLDLSQMPLYLYYQNCELFNFVFGVGRMFPNLQALNFSNSPAAISVQLLFYPGIRPSYCSPSFHRIIRKNCDWIWFDGCDLKRFASLTHLVLDGSTFWTGHDASEDTDSEYFLLMKCKHLKHLSVKDASLNRSCNGKEPLLQSILINLARHHPTLRLLRSDLSAENVETLKQERPDITFVS